MKTCADCGPCLMKRILFQSRLAGTGTEFEAVRQCMARYSELMDESVCSAEIATKVHRLSYDIMRCEDPYHTMKIDADQIAGTFLKKVEEILGESEDRFRAAVSVAVVGNIMDFGSGIAIDYPEEFNEIFEKLISQKIGLDECDELRALIEKSENILYTFDNCGESQFDKFLIREIRSMGKRVVGVVKGAPILNDVTLDDAERIGLDKELDGIVTTGAFAIGIPSEIQNPDLIEMLSEADLLLAKGMANFESLSERDLGIPVAYLLKAKCLPVANSFNVPVGTNVVKVTYPKNRIRTSCPGEFLPRCDHSQ